MNGDMKSMNTSYASKLKCVNENKKLWISGWVSCKGRPSFIVYCEEVVASSVLSLL